MPNEEHELRSLSSRSDTDSHDSLEPTVTMPSDLRTDPDQHALNRRTVRKIDFFVLPWCALLFLFNALDKSNIGNAETAHFTDDIGIAKEDLNVAVGLFYFFFVSLQPVGAGLGRRYGMKRWVPGCMFLWGFCTALHVWVHSAWQLYILRIAIATLEAGFYPTTVTYLSLFYTRFEFGKRIAIFYGQAAVAGALGGLISWAVFKAFPGDKPGDLPSAASSSSWHSWQILFILEGCATMITAFVSFFWLPNRPKNAWFLSPEERDWAEERIRQDRDGEILQVRGKGSPSPTPDPEDVESTVEAQEAQGLLSQRSGPTFHAPSPANQVSDQGITAHDVLSTVLDWKIYYLLACNILSAVPATAFPIFLPIILSPLSTTPALANLLSAPPYVFGAITLFAFTAWSDRNRNRTKPILISLTIVLVGFAGTILLPSAPTPDATTTTADAELPPDPHALLRYLSLNVLLAGTFIASPLTVTWLTNNFPSPGKRALALGINGWGNVAGVIASALFAPTPLNRASGYRAAFAWSAALVAVALVGFAAFRALLRRENETRARVVAAWSEDEIEEERCSGTGPLRLRSGASARRVDAALDAVDAWPLPGAARVAAWVREWRQAPRQGDERVTFAYGL
ncbi:major facilitator superfamily domain-containing protein [Phyllosticta citribraziliensis]|uniref:Major facilitator superfamily domain-containing protein n=1 Tax=Phyllosticta citribraziliensis TaxID=989973 RepID=A0ABR1LD20_9PEZI